MRFVVSVALVLFCAVALSVAEDKPTATPPNANSMSQCAARVACRPWPGTDEAGNANKACKKGGRMDLRFALGTSAAHYDKNGRNSTGYGVDISRPYFFCPKVDELQAFLLNGSAKLAALGRDDHTGQEKFSQDPNITRLWVYGMGERYNVELPQDTDDGSIVVYEGNSTACTNNGPALVNFLLLNITMKKGKYNYVNGFDQPVNVGFKPTCDELDSCAFNNPGAATQSVCIGNPGKKNCATCLKQKKDKDGKLESPSDALKGKNVKIWAAYYGTDKDGRTLRSGASNPLNFRQFAATPVVNDLASGLQDLEHKF